MVWVAEKLNGIRRTATGSDIYGYKAHNGVTPTMNKRERLTTVRQRRDNGKTSQPAQSDDITSMIQNIGNALAQTFRFDILFGTTVLDQRLGMRFSA